MARSNSAKPCKSTGSELLVYLSENSYYSLTKGGWKASGYADPIEYNGTNERDSRPRAKFDQDITFNSTSIYSSSSSRLDVSGVVYSCLHGSQAGGGFVDQLFDHQSNPRLRRVIWNPWQSNGKLRNMKNRSFEVLCHKQIRNARRGKIAEEAMNFMSYVAEVSRGWDEPNARDMGRMTSQPKAKGEMYILNDGMNMKAKIAAMERRLEELEMNQMQEVQAISQTSLQAMPCAICRSYEHLVDECPTIPAEREMFGDCNTYNSNWRDHPNFSWKPQSPQYKQHVQALPQASILEQAIANLSKVVGEFVGKQEATNARVDQRIDRVESMLNKRMDEVQNDLSQKLDILQDSISRLANLNTVQEKENSPSQPYQNSMSIHEMEVEEGEPSQKREAKEMITLRSGGIAKKLKEVFRSEIGAKSERKQSKNRGKTGVCEISQPLRNRHFAAKPVRSLRPLSVKIFVAVKPILAHECHFAVQEHLFRSCETHCEEEKPDFATKVPFRRVFRGCEADFGTRVPFRSTVTLISQLRNDCEVPKREKSQFRSQSSILKSISQLQNHFLAHECHLEALHTHFTAAKWLRNLHTLKSFSAHTMS
uniref:Uncharacterized protein n=1 Tax=Vitis vinifera TaxID=29760 RepID=A5C9V8_VITVI|nr:hypothetical protein VITISV_043503 [Vitis vinifera]